MAFSRRGVLSGLLGSAVAIGSGAAYGAIGRVHSERHISFLNLHTGETVRTAYWAEGSYLREGMTEVARVLRDHRTNELHPIQPALLDVLHALEGRLGLKDCRYHVISGYRSPATNARLAAASSGVARDSLHTRGMAIDIRADGVALPVLRDAAKTLAAGGVGFYPRSGFVHIDIGRVRYW